MPKSLDQIFGQQGQSKSLESIFGGKVQPREIPGDDNGAFASSVQGFNSIVPFGNRLTAGAASLALAPFTDLTISELYDSARANQKATEEASPTANLVGTGAGIAATLPVGLTKAAATTPGLGNAANTLNKASAATANFIRGGEVAKDAGALAKAGSLALRSAKSAGVAAPTAALYQYGASDKDGIANPERITETLEAAKLGGAVGAALPVAGAAVAAGAAGAKNVISGAFSRSADELETAAKTIKDSSSKAYQAMRDAGAVINKPRAVNIANRVEHALRQDGILNRNLHANTLGLLDDFKQAAREGDFTLEELDQWRQLFGQVAGNFSDKLNARKASIAIEAIDDAVDKLAKIDIRGGKTEAIEALNVGRAEWARARKFERIADIVKKSEGDANYLKREFKKILNTPKLQRGLSGEEMSAIRQAAQTTITDDVILKTLGRFGFDHRRIGTGVGAAVGSGVGYSMAGGPAALAIPVLGTAARQARNYGGLGKAENILRTIEGTSNKLTTKSGRIPPALSIPSGAAAGVLNESQSPRIMQPTMQRPLPPRSDSGAFDTALNFVFETEGGYVSDDAGKGETNMGVNKTANPDLDIKNLTTDKARSVYKTRYWNAINADKLPPQLAMVGFDAAVNHGVEKAREMLRASGGDPIKLLKLREREYARLVRANPKKYAQYAEGWLDRLHRLQAEIA